MHFNLKIPFIFWPIIKNLTHVFNNKNIKNMKENWTEIEVMDAFSKEMPSSSQHQEYCCLTCCVTSSEGPLAGVSRTDCRSAPRIMPRSHWWSSDLKNINTFNSNINRGLSRSMKYKSSAFQRSRFFRDSFIKSVTFYVISLIFVCCLQFTNFWDFRNVLNIPLSNFNKGSSTWLCEAKNKQFQWRSQLFCSRSIELCSKLAPYKFKSIF